ncbi:hypothetical protein FB446DRAFT_789699 [Lentinula raphanica]|nr:hypothetical protein FB446DRAFT_789699 [Lentinula raphanica]
MYPFRLHTWHSLAVNGLLISMFVTAIALSIESDRTELRIKQRIAAEGNEAGPSYHNAVVPISATPRKFTGEPRNPSPKKAKTSQPRLSRTAQARSTPKEFIVGVIIKNGMEQVTQNGQEEWVRKEKLDPNADWVMAFIQPEQLSQSRIHKVRVWGYQTFRDTVSDESIFNPWKAKVTDGVTAHPSLYGVRVSLSRKDLFLPVGTVKMSENAKSDLTRVMIEDLDQSHSDKLPDVLSIYDVLFISGKRMGKHSRITVVSFDMSESSAFGEAFDEMVRAKGTGAGRVVSAGDKWEWELYERVKSGTITLRQSLVKRKNQDILEDLWNEVYSPKSVVPSTSSQHLPSTSSQHGPSTSSQKLSSTPEYQDPSFPKWVFKDQDFDEWKDSEAWSEGLVEPSKSHNPKSVVPSTSSQHLPSTSSQHLPSTSSQHGPSTSSQKLSSTSEYQDPSFPKWVFKDQDFDEWKDSEAWSEGLAEPSKSPGQN